MASPGTVRSITGVVYDERMADHECLWDSTYNERPERFKSILHRCRELDLIDRCLTITPREATRDELLKLHSPGMITTLKETDDVYDVALLEDLSSKYDFMYFHPNSNKLSLLSAGSTIELVDNIIDGNIRNGMAIIRPPGHHAMNTEYCGYCFYNNVALAAQHALDNKGIKKILIVDWDVHHGQATQQMFYHDPRVLYFSIHGYQNGKFWPHLRESDYHYIGRGAGAGYNINVPLNEIKMSDCDYMAIIEQLLLPIASEFQPELIIISAGYDAALGCPEGEMELTPAFYAHMTSALMGFASGRMAVVLEGGYCLKSLAEGAALTLRTLLGDPCPSIDKLLAPCQSVRETIASLQYVLRNYWSCLRLQDTFRVNQVKGQSGVSGVQFWPVIQFFGNDEKPDRYQTRGICPAQDENVARQMDSRLNALIGATCLSVPKHRVAVVDSQQILVERARIVDRCLILKKTVREPISTNDSLTNQETAAVSVIDLLDSVLCGESRSAIICGSRSIPGDSSSECYRVGWNLPSGNCTAKATEYAIRDRGLERVLVVDFKFNYDNETRCLFEEDPRVLYISVPCLNADAVNGRNSATEFVGTGSGTGFTINIAAPNEPMGNAEYLTLFYSVIFPVAHQFNPQLVLVTTGYGSLGEERVTRECMGQMIHILLSLSQGRLVLVLEGHEESLVQSLRTLAMPLFGDPLSIPSYNIPSEDFGKRVVQPTIQNVKQFWNALQFDVQLPDENVLIPPWISDSKVHQHNPDLYNYNLGKNG